MKILLLGASGQVGWALRRSLSPLGEVIALDRYGCDGLTGDISDKGGMQRTVDLLCPDIIVNAAAYTAVDRAESESDLASMINHDAVQNLAQLAKVHHAHLIHYSTDYVFDGSGGMPWCEEDKPSPLNVYGRTKLAGENAIRASGCRAVIFRTSWVYSTFGSSFVSTMVRLMQERASLSVVSDQWGAPTSADLIADVTAYFLINLKYSPQNTHSTELFHLAASGVTNWHEYACYIRQCIWSIAPNLSLAELSAIPTSEYPVPARRPLNSRMQISRLEQAYGLKMPDWHDGVFRAVRERMLTQNTI